MRGALQDEFASFLLAVQFLTRLPVRSSRLYSPSRMAGSVRHYPLVGMLVGGVLALCFFALNALFAQIIAVVLTLAAGLLLTGAFHEDGLADTFDGIGGGLNREKALVIMRDSRLGTYGTLALIVIMALKVGALSLLMPALIIIALIVGHGLSRLSSVLVIATSRYVREEGTGKPVARQLSPWSLAVALVTGGGLLALWCVFQPAAALPWACAGLIIGHLLMRLIFEPKLGGYTGDTLGAVQQTSEVGFYLGLLAWL